MGVPYYLSSGMNCYRASQARSKLNQSLTIGNNGPRSASCPSPSKPAPAKVVADPALSNALKAAARYNDGCENGISMTELRVALGAIQVTDQSLPAVKLALTEALRDIGQWDGQARKLATQLAGATDAADFIRHQSYDLAQGLDAAEAAGKAGINKPELGAIMEKVFGDSEGLSASRKALLRNAAQTGRFSRQSTANLALQLAAGKISQAQAGAIFGFSS